MTGATSGVGKKLPIQEHPSSLLIFSKFMVLRYTASDYPCCIFRLVSTVLCLSEECFMFLWLHSRPLLFYVCQRSASCYCGYILDHYCFMFVRGVLHVLVVTFSTITVLCMSEECFMLLWLHSLPLLFYVCQTSASCSCGYIFSAITVLCMSVRWFML